jgi:hypothetical protein
MSRTKGEVGVALGEPPTRLCAEAGLAGEDGPPRKREVGRMVDSMGRRVHGVGGQEVVQRWVEAGLAGVTARGGRDVERVCGMVQSRRRFLEQPQPRQRIGSLHLRTKWWGERQRKHPVSGRRGVFLGLGVCGSEGVKRAWR